MTNDTARWVFPPDADIRAVLADRIDVQAKDVGVVVGVIDADGPRVIAGGEMEKGGGGATGGDTLFEIGSNTKVFTTLLLAEMAGRGEVGLDEPVAKYLPGGVAGPSHGGAPITLTDLATHTSGLPRMDPNFRTTDPANPRALQGQAQALADYTAARLYAFLGAHGPDRGDGGFAYSNLGLGLLGHVLSLRAGLDFEALLRQRVTGPLGLADTVIAISDQQRPRLAIAHDWRLRPVANMTLQVLAGAGALRSTAHDLLAFLAMELGYAECPLEDAMQAQRAVRRPATLAHQASALGWRVSVVGDQEIVWHSGATVGSASYLGFDRQRRAGVVVLTNTRKRKGGALGLRLLTGAPLAPATPAEAP